MLDEEGPLGEIDPVDGTAGAVLDDLGFAAGKPFVQSQPFRAK